MIVVLREIMFIILMWRTEVREANGGRTLEIKWVAVEAQKERIILHSPNGHLNKQIGEETALHSIKTTFVVSELLMMYKGSFAPLSRTLRVLCFSLFSGKRQQLLYLETH